MKQSTALITGASGGIGLELARIHASQGDDLALVARSEEKLNRVQQELEQEYDVSVQLFVMDLTRTGAPEEIYTALKSDGVVVDYLINNAGIGDYGLFHKSSWVAQQTMIELNIQALTRMTHLFAGDMAARGSGRIMNVASTASFQPGPLMSVYYASKHYVLAFSEAIAQELDEFGVSVTALCPGPTESGFQARAGMENSRLVSSVPLPSSRSVAEYGYRAMMKGKRVAVHGLANRMASKLVRLVPRSWATYAVRKIQESRE
ncbi:MAG: SDR family oxidoreductase [Balneolaceae bacterium]